jgi:phospholipid transport system substrate-binding protein
MRCNLAEERKMSDRRLGRAARRLATALVGLAAVAASSASSLAAAAPQETIRNFYSVLLGAMKNGPTLGIRGRYDQIAPAIEQKFDLSYMLQKTVGLAWRTLPDEQKKQVWVAFARYMTATYADRFHGYSGEKFEVTGQQNTPYGTIVESRIVKSNGEPVSINYLIRVRGRARGRSGLDHTAQQQDAGNDGFARVPSWPTGTPPGPCHARPLGGRVRGSADRSLSAAVR